MVRLTCERAPVPEQKAVWMSDSPCYRQASWRSLNRRRLVAFLDLGWRLASANVGKDPLFCAFGRAALKSDLAHHACRSSSTQLIATARRQIYVTHIPRKRENCGMDNGWKRFLLLIAAIVPVLAGTAETLNWFGIKPRDLAWRCWPTPRQRVLFSKLVARVRL